MIMGVLSTFKILFLEIFTKVSAGSPVKLLLLHSIEWGGKKEGLAPGG